MKCSSVKSLIDSYLDGACDAKKSRSVEEHIASCKECAEEFEYAKRVRERMKTLPSVKAPAGFEEKIFRLTGTTAPSSGMKFVRFLNRKTVLIPLGSAAVIIMGLSIFLISDFRTDNKSADTVVASKAGLYDSKQTDEKISDKKETANNFAAKAPVKRTPAPEPSKMKRAKEMKPAGGYVETEVQLSYNETDGLAKADLPSSQAIDATASEESARDSDSIELKKSVSRSSAGKEKSERSEAPRSLKQQDDFFTRIDRVILSSGGTRVRLTARSPVKASAGGNNTAARDPYTAKVIIPEEEYDGLIKRLSELGTLSAPAVRPVAEKGYMEFILTVRRGN